MDQNRPYGAKIYPDLQRSATKQKINADDVTQSIVMPQYTDGTIKTIFIYKDLCCPFGCKPSTMAWSDTKRKHKTSFKSRFHLSGKIYNKRFAGDPEKLSRDPYIGELSTKTQQIFANKSSAYIAIA